MPSALRPYLHPRVIAILLLGFASGLPLALTGSTLLTWLPEAGVDITTVGLFAAIGTPYAFKFLWSPVVDGTSLPFFTKTLGRRRGWMVLTQLCLIGAILGLGASNPADNPWITAFWALLVATFSATQDIVIDAYRIELLEKEQQSLGASAVQIGYRFGMLVSGAGALALASFYGWSVTYTLMAVVMTVGIITVLIAGEPSASHQKPAAAPGTHPVAHWLATHVVQPFVDFAKHPGWSMILLFIICFKLGDAFAGVMTNPFLLAIGFTKIEIATIVKTYGLGATLLGLFLGGALIQKIGVVPSLWITGILQMLSNLVFVAQAHLGHDPLFLSLTISVENLSSGMGSAVFVTYLSSLCNISYTATQYALLSSLAVSGRTWLSAGSGKAVALLDWPMFFVFSTVLAIPGLLLLAWMTKTIKQLPSRIVPEPISEVD